MSRQICDATDGVALDLDVWRHHLSYEWGEAAEANNEYFVLA